MSAATAYGGDWEAAAPLERLEANGHPFALRDDEGERAAPCEGCIALTAELARARAALRAIARTEAKPAKSETGDDPADCAAIGYAVAMAAVRARAEIALGRKI